MTAGDKSARILVTCLVCRAEGHARLGHGGIVLQSGWTNESDWQRNHGFQPVCSDACRNRLRTAVSAVENAAKAAKGGAA